MPKEADRKGGTPFRKEMKAMEPILKRLEKATRRLNTTGDRANELIRGANERLQALGAGVEFWPEFGSFVLRTETPARKGGEEEGADTTSRYDHVLGYTKLGSWQLAIRVYHFGPDPDFHDPDSFAGEEAPFPVLSADRELRIKAAALLPEFLKAYAEQLQKLADHLPESE